MPHWLVHYGLMGWILTGIVAAGAKMFGEDPNRPWLCPSTHFRRPRYGRLQRLRWDIGWGTFLVLVIVTTDLVFVPRLTWHDTWHAALDWWVGALPAIALVRAGYGHAEATITDRWAEPKPAEIAAARSSTSRGLRIMAGVWLLGLVLRVFT